MIIPKNTKEFIKYLRLWDKNELSKEKLLKWIENTAKAEKETESLNTK